MLLESRPGETPIDDFSGLKIKGITTRRELDAYEAGNIRKAAMKYLLSKPSKSRARFDFTWLLQLHKEMFGEVWQWAGELRTRDLNIGVASQHIEAGLYQLTGDLKYWLESGRSVHECAVQLHHKAVSIHPFHDGNGRWSRMLEDILLKQHGESPTPWPNELIGCESPIRKEYLAALKSADNGDYDPLMKLHWTHHPCASLNEKGSRRELEVP